MRSFDMGAHKAKFTLAAAFLMVAFGAPFSVRAASDLTFSITNVVAGRTAIAINNPSNSIVCAYSDTMPAQGSFETATDFFAYINSSQVLVTTNPNFADQDLPDGIYTIVSRSSVNTCTDIISGEDRYELNIVNGSIQPDYQDTHINSLTPNAVSTTSPFVFGLSFFNGTTTPVSRVRILLNDPRLPDVNWIDSDIPLSFPQNQDILYSAQLAAYPYSSWILTAVLYGEFDQVITATSTEFSIASDSTGYDNYDPTSGVSTSSPGGFIYNIPQFVGSSFGTTSLASSTNFLSFLNIPELLKTKIPFAYIFQISSSVRSSVASSSASTIPSSSFNINFPIPGVATTTLTIDLFSTTTITYFLTPTWVNLLRGIMVAVTYFSLGWFLFHEAKKPRLLR